MPGCNSLWNNVCTIEDHHQQPQNENEIEGNPVSSPAIKPLASKSSCVRGECYADDLENPIAKCVCEPGWGGDHCERPLTWLEFTKDAFLKFRMNYDADDRAENHFDILFLPGQSDSGSIASAVGPAVSGQSTASSVRLELSKHKMRASFDSMPFSATPTIELELTPKLNYTTPYYVQFYRSPARFANYNFILLADKKPIAELSLHWTDNFST